MSKLTALKIVVAVAATATTAFVGAAAFVAHQAGDNAPVVNHENINKV